MSNKVVGIFGGGQLGAMLAQSVLPLGVSCVFLEDNEDCPASLLGDVYSSAQYDEFVKRADIFTLEFENTDVTRIANLNKTDKKCFPSENALAVAQDRLKEKNTFKKLGVATVPFEAVYNQEDLAAAVESLGLPIVLKTTQGGYDGKGQFVIKNENDIVNAWQELGNAVPLIAEGFINFSREVSIIAVRGQNGEIKTYPLIENHHHEGILAYSIAPAPMEKSSEALHAKLTEQAKNAISTILNHFDYVGVLTLELFVTEEGILANEIAPRVHNSGHWSIEGAHCSQFENHMRAVLGLPLGSVDIVSPSVMFNVIGELPKSEDVLKLPKTHLHLYNKEERPGRKLGHITVATENNSNQTVAEVKTTVGSMLPNKLNLINS